MLTQSLSGQTLKEAPSGQTLKEDLNGQTVKGQPQQSQSTQPQQSQSAQPQTQQPQQRETYRGQLRDRLTEEPISMATVILLSADSTVVSTTLSSDGGTFELSGEGAHWLQVNHLAYQTCLLYTSRCV